jgi:hypothetical protein
MHEMRLGRRNYMCGTNRNRSRVSQAPMRARSQPVFPALAGPRTRPFGAQTAGPPRKRRKIRAETSRDEAPIRPTGVWGDFAVGSSFGQSPKGTYRAACERLVHRARFQKDRARFQYLYLSNRASVAAISAGVGATATPASSSASIFSAAVPLPPEMMAPA